MPEDTKQQPPMPLEENASNGGLGLDEILKSAQTTLLTIKELVETAKAATTDTTESQKLIAKALDGAQAKVHEITNIATQVLAAKTQITDEQAVIATKSAHIQNAQEHADKVRAALDQELTLAKQKVTDTEALKLNVKSAADDAAKLLTDIQTAKGTLVNDLETIGASRKVAEQSAELTKNLADKAATVEERIAAYEKRLAELEVQCADQLKKIEAALPGATSAGLAHDFNERRKAFLNPHNRWQWAFIISLLAIVALTGTGLAQVYFAKTPPTYDELLLLWMSRLPVVGALVWLALHASRESALAKRLEEDYGYKAAIASCFVGFQKQMSELGKDELPNSPIAKLLDNTLKTIATPPGRIYDRHKLTVSPIGELTEATKTVVDAGVTKLGSK